MLAKYLLHSSIIINYILTLSHLIHISVMPSELGTSSFMPNLFCEMFTSGVTSHPFRLTLYTGKAFLSASSAVLYIFRCKSRHINQYRLNAFSVNIFGLEQHETNTLRFIRFALRRNRGVERIESYSLQKSQVIGQLSTMVHVVHVARRLETFERDLKI